jgi:hypothetical protein
MRSNTFGNALSNCTRPLCTMREFAWMEDGGVVGESGAEAVPVKIVECLDEIGERLADLGFSALRRGRIIV